MAEPLPRSLVDYIRTTGALKLLSTQNLDVYVTTAEATRSSDPDVLGAQTSLAQVRRMLDDLGRPGSGVTEVEVVSELHETLGLVQSMLSRRSTPLASEAIARTQALSSELKSRVRRPRRIRSRYHRSGPAGPSACWGRLRNMERCARSRSSGAPRPSR